MARGNASAVRLTAWRQVAARGGAVVVAAALCWVGSWWSDAAFGAAAGGPLAAPLVSAWSTPQGTWAIVAMGRTGHANNTFWELFFRQAGGDAWGLVTPPAVADNGGLVGDDAPTAELLAGFEPSQALHFSPVARTVDEGSSWSPGVLPDPLAPVPDAVAVGPHGALLALTRAPHAALESSPTGGTHWRTLVELGALATTPAGRRCGLVALEALTVDGSDPVLGGACTSPGTVGVFTHAAGVWTLSGPRLTERAASRPVSVLRLEPWGSGTAGLIQVGRGASATLYAMWRDSPEGGWTLSPPLRPQGSLQATAFGPKGVTAVVTSGRGGGRQAEAVGGPGASWAPMPRLPYDTAALAEGTDGRVDALTVTGGKLGDWTLAPTARRWQRGAVLSVPIAYGSST